MNTNLEKYRADIEDLIGFSTILLNAMTYECNKKEYEIAIRKQFNNEEATNFLKNLPEFGSKYQSWYSEAQACIKQLLPDRLADFIKQYEKPKSRKEITFENYMIEDYLIGYSVTFHGETKVAPKAAIPKFKQQLEILRATKRRLKSSLFDIKQLVQADLFDTELETARELLKKGFTRAAGAISGVILEKHLLQVSNNHNLTLAKKNPTIADLNDLLRNSDVLDVPAWRNIQHLGDLRNLAAHNKDKEPSPEQMTDLIDGVAKMTKTLF